MEHFVLKGEDLRLWRAFLHWTQGIHAEVNKAVATAADLSVSEFEVLTRLWSEPDRRLPQSDLITSLGWSASRASHLLARLETRGFVRREDSGAGRARTVEMTDAGLTQLEKAFGAHGASFHREVLSQLDDRERQTLMAIMARYNGADQL